MSANLLIVANLQLHTHNAKIIKGQLCDTEGCNYWVTVDVGKLIYSDTDSAKVSYWQFHLTLNSFFGILISKMQISPHFYTY